MHQLYKRLLLTLFPEEMKQADINPATMFISSLSAKEFFSLLSRKVTEYYKINGFDTGLETFEAKIGMGKEQGISVNKANDYYGYLIAAQYNGKGFFSPTFVSTHITLYSATLLAPLLKNEPEDTLIHTMVMIYLMPLLFVTHIKRFPSSLTPKEQYNRFVTLCLEILHFVMEEEDETITQTISHVLNHESSVLRNLVVICQHAEQLFPLDDDADAYRDWMLDAHVFSHDDEAVQLFLDAYDKQSHQPTIADYEEEIMTMLFPSDFSIRGLYDQVSIFDTIKYIITPWYSGEDNLETLRQGLSDDTKKRSAIISCFSNITHAKGRFWSGVQQFIMHHRTQQELDIHEDIDEFMSSIEDDGLVDMDKVPESIRAESRVIDQIVHFYIGVVGGQRGAKNDTFWYRWINRDRHRHTPSSRSALEATDHHYWRDHFALYDTNGFYYQRAWEHIRQGKQKFHIPLRASLRFGTNDSYTREQIAQSAVMGLLNTTHQTRMRLTIHQSTILDMFADRYARRIRSQLDDTSSPTDREWSMIDRLTGAGWSDTFSAIVGDQDISKPLADTLYRFDRWLRRDVVQSIVDDHELLALLQSLYDDRTLIVFVNELQKTLFGIMLRIVYEEKHHQTHGSGLRHLYLRDVLHVDEMLRTGLQHIFQDYYRQSHDLLDLRIQIDDNQLFLQMCSRMWHDFQSTKEHTITTEDILWLHSTLCHISAYNTRYVIPE